MFVSNNEPGAWDTVWSRKDAFIQFIDAGRDIYNLFFRRMLLRRITPQTEMIELGCGGSTMSLSIAGRMKRLVGLDHSPASIKLSEENAKRMDVKNAEFALGDILNLPPGLKNRFDLVWSQGLLEHFDDYDAVVKAHLDVAKPGGRIVISVPFKYSYHVVWHRLTRNKYLKKFWPWDADQKFLTYNELHRLGGRFSKEHKVFLLKPALAGMVLGIIIVEFTKPA